MRSSILVILVLSVATCGQKGPLRLPEPEASSVLAAVVVVAQRP